MNVNNLTDAFSDVDSKYVSEMQDSLNKNNRKERNIKWIIPVAAAFILLVGIFTAYGVSRFRHSIPVVKPSETSAVSESANGNTSDNNLPQLTDGILNSDIASDYTTDNGVHNVSPSQENPLMPSTRTDTTDNNTANRQSTTKKRDIPTTNSNTTESQGQKETSTTQNDSPGKRNNDKMYEPVILAESQEYLNATAPYVISRHHYLATPLHEEIEDDSGKSHSERYKEYHEVELYRWQFNNMWQPASSFIRNSTPVFLSEKSGENAVYSPINVYFALSMLAETTGGESRSQILSALNESDISSLRNRVKGVWNFNYLNNGLSRCIFANSIWLNDKFSYKKDTLDIIADNYYASSFSGDMSSEGYNNAFRQWMNTQTGNMLENQISNVRFRPETEFLLASTVLFNVEWQAKFNESLTKTGTFNTSGKKISTSFMHKKGLNDKLYYGENFTAVEQRLIENGSMLFILPDKGITPEALLTDSETMDFVLSNTYSWEKQKMYDINYSIPKFDIESELDLKDGMIKLGVEDCFDSKKANFTPISDESFGAISKVTHGVRVSIDEKGVAASAYTVIDLLGSAPQECKEYNFTLNRPFLFVIKSLDGLPLFIGIVNNPS